MFTPVFIAGAEDGIVTVGASAGQPPQRRWNSVSGQAPSISTTVVRSGLRSYRFNPTLGASNLEHVFASAQNVFIFRKYVRFDTVPDFDCTMMSMSCVIGADAQVRWKSSDNTIQIRFATGTQVGSFAPATGIWYRLDGFVDCRNNPNTFDLMVDGVPLTQATLAQAADTVDGLTFGASIGSNVTADVYYDDIVCSQTAGDYPIGPGRVVGLSPNADGTHSFTDNDFEYNDTTAFTPSATDVYTYVDERPITAIADFISQNVIRSTGYVEVQLEDLVGTIAAIHGIEVISTHHSAATQANNSTMKLNDGGTLQDVYTSKDWSQTTAVFQGTSIASAPSGGRWTQDKINALRIRWGYAGDITPAPYFDGLLVEVSYTEMPPPHRRPFAGQARNLRL